VPLEAFHAALQSFHPSLVVISGLHLLEGQSKEFREKRLAAVRTAIRDAAIAKDTKIHLELASIGDITLTQQIVNSVLADVDSLGLNEQELGSVFTVLNGKPAGDAFKDPKSRLTIQTIKQLFSHVDQMHKDSPHSVRRLNRVHFHCISYHLIVQRRGSSWADAKTAVASASLAASKQACDTERPSPSQFYLLAPLHLQQHEDDTTPPVPLNLNEPGIYYAQCYYH
jgi:ADP-dependent glucokinase